MSARKIATFSKEEVEQNNTSKSCYVTIGSKVYDVTNFIDDHPGGEDLILDYAGQDVGDIMTDENSHMHSEAAYEVLEDNFVGLLIKQAPPKTNGTIEPTKPAVYENTGLSCEEDLSKETDFDNDYKTHHFLDLNRPLLMQVWNGGFSKEFYLEQVHRPRHYKGGASAPLFGNFLEPLSLTPWWVVPMLWLPCVSYGVFVSCQGLGSVPVTALYWTFGLMVWTLIEYGLHRCLFHLDDYLPDNRVGITLHFLLHGVHHYLPMDKYRLVMPPALFILLAIPFWNLAHSLFAYNWFAATAVFCGGVFGYICYDLTHYFLHHRNLPYYWRQLKKYHLRHHFADYQNGFGVTSRFWDKIFNTELEIPPPKVLKAS